MITTAEIAEAIKTLVAASNLFKSVVRYPFARVNEEDVFFNDLQKFKLPTCLIVFTNDNQDGKPAKRESDFTLILVFKGSEIDAGDACMAAVDSIRESVLGASISAKVLLRPTSRVAMLESTANFTAATMAIKTVEHA